MMPRQEQHVLLVSELYEGGAYQGALRQIKRPLNFYLRQRIYLRFLLMWGQFLQVHSRHGKTCGQSNDLEGLAGNGGKSCAQDFMTPDDFLEALLQCHHLQGTAQTYCFQQVVGMTTEPQLLKEPQALLGI